MWPAERGRTGVKKDEKLISWQCSHSYRLWYHTWIALFIKLRCHHHFKPLKLVLWVIAFLWRALQIFHCTYCWSSLFFWEFWVLWRRLFRTYVPWNIGVTACRQRNGGLERNFGLLTVKKNRKDRQIEKKRWKELQNRVRAFPNFILLSSDQLIKVRIVPILQLCFLYCTVRTVTIILYCTGRYETDIILHSHAWVIGSGFKKL